MEHERNFVLPLYKRLRAIRGNELWKIVIGNDRKEVWEARLKSSRMEKRDIQISTDGIAKVMALLIGRYTDVSANNLSRKFRMWKRKEETGEKKKDAKKR